jgi:hypothetical protein
MWIGSICFGKQVLDFTKETHRILFSKNQPLSVCIWLSLSLFWICWPSHLEHEYLKKWSNGCTSAFSVHHWVGKKQVNEFRFLFSSNWVTFWFFLGCEDPFQNQTTSWYEMVNKLLQKKYFGFVDSYPSSKLLFSVGMSLVYNTKVWTLHSWIQMIFVSRGISFLIDWRCEVLVSFEQTVTHCNETWLSLCWKTSWISSLRSKK